MNTVQDKLEQIKADIASKKLTYPQIREKLETLIEHEYSKEGGPDVDLVIACEDLLWRLGTDNAPFVTREDQYKEAIKSRIEASQRTRQIKKPVLRFVAALVVVVLLLGGAEVFLHREWFEQSDTADQQQHIVQGFVVDPELVEKAIAGENEATTLSTTDYQEVRNYLGFDLPQALFINDWEPELYFLDIQPIYIKVVIMYSHKDDKQSQLMLDARLFTDVEDAYVPYEQEQNGTMEMVGDIPVYFSNNYDVNTSVWITDNCVCQLRGTIEKSQLKRIVQQIIGGEKHE